MTRFLTPKEFVEELSSRRPDIIDEMVESEPIYEVAREIIKERKRKNWSQEELARKANLTQAQVSRIERAEIGNVRTLFKVLDALGLKLTVQCKN
jgi:ribosome-binding protein aMBF1 (putative translation factor)